MEETLAINGINVCYDVKGAGEPLLLVHGLHGGRRVWDQLTAEAAKRYTVYAVDLPGFGCSDAPDVPYGIPFYVDFLLEFMNAVGIDRVNIAGSSMGGEIAAMFAARNPERVSGLVLIAPGGLTPLHTRFSNAGWLMNADFWLLSKNKSLYRKTFEEKFADPAKIPEWLVDETWEQLKNSAYRKALLRNIQYLSHQHPQFPDALGAIQARTLIIWGGEDLVLPASDTGRFADLIKRVEVRVLENCGHMVLLECGEQLNDILLSFLGEEELYYTSEEM